ncbi:MAG TPA: 3'-5' exonuclease, partial [Candidatus Binataceae bacterium]|nr:3'-5' exonuclease [Candidatus Binataceae bacterium]
MSRYQELSAQFYSNRLLFGDPAEPGIVAVEVATPTTVDIYRRSGGSLSSERRPIRLFALLEDVALLHGFRRETRVRPLAGDFRFRVMVEVGSLVLLEDLKRHLRATTTKPAAAPNAPYFVLADPIEQHLMLSGMTFFMGFEFADLRRLQLDIETYITPGFEFPSAARDTDRIVAISITDTGGLEQVLRGTEMDERAMLSELVRIIAERDPDIIEGHNLFRFDLEYIEARARRVGVNLALGRDGSTLRARPSRLQIAERSIQYRRYDITGRSIVDTWILAQHYDIASRELEGFGLKDLALHFGIAADSRTYLDAAKVSDYFDRDPETLYAYALDDARETRELAALLSPSYFVQAQIFPYSYQSAILRGNATKIDALMMRAYLREGHSIPEPQPVAPVVGGYTEIRRAGVAHNVLHCDVTSLYPSLMIQYRLAPQSDRLGVFLRLLEDLRSFRVQAKAAVKELGGIERRNLEALQQTFKILINSFYG